MNGRPIIQIAYADDHRIVRQGISQFIQEMDGGFNVFIQACDGQELLDKIAEAPYQPDICILDIAMPVMNGYETALQLRKKYPAIRILALTILGFETEYPVLKMMQNGAGGYLCKSSDTDEVERALIDIYTTGFYFSKAVLEKFPKMNRNNLREYCRKLFSEQDTELLTLCCSALTYAEIAEKMCLSQRTVEKHAAQLCDRLNLHTRVELAMYALCAGIGSFTHSGLV